MTGRRAGSVNTKAAGRSRQKTGMDFVRERAVVAPAISIAGPHVCYETLPGNASATA